MAVNQTCPRCCTLATQPEPRAFNRCQHVTNRNPRVVHVNRLIDRRLSLGRRLRCRRVDGCCMLWRVLGTSSKGSECFCCHTEAVCVTEVAHATAAGHVKRAQASERDCNGPRHSHKVAISSRPTLGFLSASMCRRCRALVDSQGAISCLRRASWPALRMSA